MLDVNKNILDKEIKKKTIAEQYLSVNHRYPLPSPVKTKSKRVISRINVTVKSHLIIEFGAIRRVLMLDMKSRYIMV